MSDRPEKPQKFVKGGGAGRSSGRTSRGERTSGGGGRDRPMPGYGQSDGRKKPPPEARPETKPKEPPKEPPK